LLTEQSMWKGGCHLPPFHVENRPPTYLLDSSISP
jgi:hypothetical protein